MVVDASAEPPKAEEHAHPRARSAERHLYRGGVLVVVLAVAFAIVLIPVGVVSVLHILNQPATGHTYRVMKAGALGGEWTELNIAASSISESDQTVTLRVSGFHQCPAACTPQQVELFSVRADPSRALGAPPSTVIQLPATSGEVDQQVTLPVEGRLIDYPFDKYTLLLGVAFARVEKDGEPSALTPHSASSALAYSLGDDIPRVNMSQPADEKPQTFDRPGVRYDSVVAVTLSRPAYLKILNVDLPLLIIVSAIYGVIFRPFTQIIPTVGGIVLGVWGVRSLLVGSYPPDSTGIDLILETAIFVVLVVVGIRSVQFMWPRTEFGRAKPPAEPPAAS